MTDQQRCPERWVNGIATFTVPLDIPVDASDLEKLEAATARFGDEFLFRFDGADVTFEISDDQAEQ